MRAWIGRRLPLGFFGGVSVSDRDFRRAHSRKEFMATPSYGPAVGFGLGVGLVLWLCFRLLGR